MDVHIRLDGQRDLGGEIYRQLRSAIRDGLLRTGERLPPSRELARRLNVARMTVTTAYERLVGEGYATSRIGSGTFVGPTIAIGGPSQTKVRARGRLRPRPVWATVRSTDPAFARPAPFDFRSGIPDVSLFPHKAWRRLVVSELRRGEARAATYGEPQGHRELREAITRHIAVSRGVEASADDVTVTNGTQQALDIVVRLLLAPGDRVAVEAPGYLPPRMLFRSAGLRVTGVPVDESGLVVDDLPEDARLVYATPSHQYPLGVSMSISRRLGLLAWAQRHDAAIVEDDYDSEFRYADRPVESLHALDSRGRVIYVGSFSKTMLPTLRLGFLVTPPALRSAVRLAKFVADWHTELPLQAALARFIEDGDFARHLRRMRTRYWARHESIKTILARDFTDLFGVVPSVTGLHLTVISRSLSARRLAAAVRGASALGVEAQDLVRFAVEGLKAPTGLVLGYGAIPTERIADGLRILRQQLDAATRS